MDTLHRQTVTRLEQLYLHHVSNVDDESVLPGPHPHPLPRMSLDLQPTNFVLEGRSHKQSTPRMRLGNEAETRGMFIHT
jgi:hypothetical protein